MRVIVTLGILLALGTAKAEIKGEPVEYKQGDTVLKGHIAYDETFIGKRPGVIVVHEWWGQNQHARNQAKRLAEAGYVALAVDMYGEGKVTTHPEDAGKMSGQLRENAPLAKARFLAGMALLQQHESVDPERIAAIGYCFGGGVVLEMARAGVDLGAVVSFHGSLKPVDPDAPRDIKARVLVCHGSEDYFVTPEDIANLKKEMAAAGAEFEFLVLEGAEHSFTNPEADTLGIDGLGYSADADRKSWDAMLKTLEEVFEAAPVE